MIDFKEEGQKLCKDLKLPCKIYQTYLSNKLELMYAKGKNDIMSEFNKMREKEES